MSDDDGSFIASLVRRDGWTDLATARIAPLDGGMSDATVYVVDGGNRPRRYLKTARHHAAAVLRDEVARTRWLAQRGVRVPEVLRIDDQGDHLVVLTAAVPGLAAEASPLPVPCLIDALARGLAALHALPPGDCPFDESVAVRLSRATAAVAAGEVDPEAFAPRNLGVAPEVLLARLTRAMPPAEDIVVVHGDATLSNILVSDDGTIGFVDCGNAGRGDRYVDLAVLAAEIEDTYGPKASARFAQAYDARGWDSAKARYFADLYELF